MIDPQNNVNVNADNARARARRRLRLLCLSTLFLAVLVVHTPHCIPSKRCFVLPITN